MIAWVWRMLPALLVVLVLADGAPPAGAHAGTHRTTLSDIEDEVMCPTCGTTLQLSASPLAERQRAFILRLVEQNRTKEQIKAAMVDEFGESVLATPSRDGFGAAAYVVPVLLLGAAAVAVPFALRRWRLTRPERDDDMVAEPLPEDDAAQLDAELARWGGRGDGLRMR